MKQWGPGIYLVAQKLQTGFQEEYNERNQICLA